MNSEELKQILQSPQSKARIVQLAAAIPDSELTVGDLIDLSLYGDQEPGFRAAWILENVYCNHPAHFIPFAAYFLKRFAAQKNRSAQRHFAKILALMTAKKAAADIKASFTDDLANSLASLVFDWLIDPETPVAVKSHCLNILANFSTRKEWIREELLQTMDFLVEKESIAFFAKAKQIRKQLKVKNRQD